MRASQGGRVDLIAYEDGEVVGTGLLAGDPGTLRSSHPYVEVMVPARHRGRGVGTALLNEVSDRLRRLGKEGLQVEARSDDAYSLAYLERRGFVEVDRWAQLFLDARDPRTRSTRCYRRGSSSRGCPIGPICSRPCIGLAVATQRDQTESFHAWQVYELGDPRLRLELTALAVAEEEVVGYLTFLEFPEERTGCNRVLTVHPTRDEQAIGEALARAQIAAAKRNRLETLFTWAPPGRNQELFESLGYEARSASIDFHGPLQ